MKKEANILLEQCADGISGRLASLLGAPEFYFKVVMWLEFVLSKESFIYETPVVFCELLVLGTASGLSACSKMQ